MLESRTRGSFVFGRRRIGEVESRRGEDDLGLCMSFVFCCRRIGEEDGDGDVAAYGVQGTFDRPLVPPLRTRPFA